MESILVRSAFQLPISMQGVFQTPFRKTHKLLERHSNTFEVPCSNLFHYSGDIFFKNSSTDANFKSEFFPLKSIRNNDRFRVKSKCVKEVDNDSKPQSHAKQVDFVRWFREAWPYIQGHHGSTFVLVLPGEVFMDSELTENLLQDIALLHGLGVKIVLVPGCQIQIDKLLLERGEKSKFHGAYRITDDEALEAAMEASGRIQIQIQAKLSRGPSIPMLRRHGESDKWHDAGINIACGNFVFAKRRGVVDGVDFGSTGEVKKVDVKRIRERLDRGCAVIVSNLGFSATGEVLNCNVYEVATLCAISLHADKLLCILDGPLCDVHGHILRWMSLQQADDLIRERANQSSAARDYLNAVAGIDYIKSIGLVQTSYPSASGSKLNDGNDNDNSNANRVDGDGDDDDMEKDDYEQRYPQSDDLYVFDSDRTANGLDKNAMYMKVKNGYESIEGSRGLAIGGEEKLLRSFGYLSELTAAVFACRGGVRRVHLLDASVEGSLMLELYTRDGVGTMVSNDLYEGTRCADESDMEGIRSLLLPLEEAGVLIPRSKEKLHSELSCFTVVERDGCIIACGALFPFLEDKSAEVAAFAVSPSARGHGRGDALLDYLEKRALSLGVEKLFLLTTRTADWFVQRGFNTCRLEDLPKEKRQKININRGSKSFIKYLSSVENINETSYDVSQ